MTEKIRDIVIRQISDFSDCMIAILPMKRDNVWEILDASATGYFITPSSDGYVSIVSEQPFMPMLFRITARMLDLDCNKIRIVHYPKL